MTNVFYNNEFNLQLNKNGLVTIPLIAELDITQLKQLFAALPAVDSKGTYVTMFNPSYNYRCRVDKGIKEVCGDKIALLLKNYRTLYANFMEKKFGPEGDFPVHQDWTYVDEDKFASIAFWIPLTDVNIENGALHVVPGSHKFLTQLRGPYVHEPFAALSPVIRAKYSQPIALKAGEALVWDHRLIHFSGINQMQTPRLAVTLIMVPQSAQVIHCYSIPDSGGTKIEKYEVDTDFYMRYTIGKQPLEGSLLETIVQQKIDFDVNEFDAMFTDANAGKLPL